MLIPRFGSTFNQKLSIFLLIHQIHEDSVYQSDGGGVHWRQREIGAFDFPDLLGLEPMVRHLDRLVDAIVWLWLVDFDLGQRLELVLQVLILEAGADLANRLIFLILLVVAGQQVAAVHAGSLTSPQIATDDNQV